MTSSPEPSRSRGRLLLGRVFLCALALLVVLAAIELWHRSTHALIPYSESAYASHEEAAFTTAPGGSGTFSVNMGPGRAALGVPFSISVQGLRDRVYGPKAPGEYRVLLLGDSFAMGWGLERAETISSRLEDLLRSRGYDSVSVINAGVAGYGPWQERIFLKERCMSLDPDLVLLQLFPANDVENTLARIGLVMHSYDEGWQRHFATFSHQSAWQVATERWLHDHSFAINAWIEKGRHGAIVGLLNRLPLLGDASRSRLPKSKKRPWWLEVSLKETYPTLEQGWSMMEDDVRGIQEDCRKAGVDLLAFCIAGGQSLTASAWESAVGKRGALYERGKEVRRTKEFFARERIASVDVMESLASHPEPSELFYQYDGHLTAEGASVVASRLAPEVEAYLEKDRQR